MKGLFCNAKLACLGKFGNHHFGFDRRRGVRLLWRTEERSNGNLYPDHYRQGYRLVLHHGFHNFDPDHRLIRLRY
jgi:hypothetical protein